MSNGLDRDQDRHSVGPDQGPNCLQQQKEKVKAPLQFSLRKATFFVISQ